ncbi:MAG: single-stranded DNA-binding protein [Candidatus Altiarchaeota archaeon]|nr:single-stranded DNA-binding protein [Candidatus Altiarchaeota archaeon]
MTKIEELTPRSRGLDMTVRVVEKLDEREVTVRSSGRQHRVAEFLIGDETGTIILSLWDDAIDQVELDKTYALKNVYVNTFRNSMRVNTGKYGSMESSEETVEANTENNVSEKFVEAPPRRNF